MSDTGRIAGVELGGTKVVGLLWQDGAIIHELRVPTRDPETTFGDLLPALREPAKRSMMTSGAKCWPH